MGAIPWICSLIGAREHYALPRALHLRGRLHTLYTDAWVGPALRWLRHGPAAFRSLAARFHPDLPARRVVAFSWAALRQRLCEVWAGAPQDVEEQYLRYLSIGQAFAEGVNRHLLGRRYGLGAVGFIGYNTGCLETLEMLREWGVHTLVNQIDPARVEEDIVLREAQKWPGWQAIPGRIPEAYYRRLESEWQTARHVLVNSEWSRQALLQQGVSAEKIQIVPLCFDAPQSVVERPPPRRELTVLWLGQVNLRKGIQYLMEAARQLADNNSLRFVVAGPIGITPEALATAPANMVFLGPVTRDRTAALFRQADLFVLPTLSDGFAITQLEALAHGLPVITTPNCASVVTDGVDGRIVPPGDAAALAAAIDEITANRARLHDFSRRALEKAWQFTLPRLADALETVLPDRTDCASSPGDTRTWLPR
jgi:glycosyltransferase involved in cell wall biosynthesis